MSRYVTQVETFSEENLSKDYTYHIVSTTDKIDKPDWEFQ